MISSPLPIPDREASMQDIADCVGVSRSAVSRVLNDRPIRISEAKRRAIHDTVARLSFRPHVAARRLKRNKTDTLRIAFPNQPEALSEIFLFELIRQVAVAAKKRHYDLLIDLLHMDANALRPLEPGHVDGTILIHDRVLPDAQVFQSETHGQPQVIIGGGTMRRRPRCFVDCDVADGMFTATGHLIKLGHRRIAFLAGVDSKAKQDGFGRALRKAGQTVDADVIKVCGLDEPSVALAVDELLARRTPVTAIAAANDVLALQIINHLSKRGIAVPTQMSVTGFDDIASARLSNPGLSTVRVPMTELADAAVEELVRQIEKRDGDGCQKIFPVQWIERGSTAPPLLPRV